MVPKTISRRGLLKTGGAAGLLAASNLPWVNIASAASSTIKIGWVGALSGIRANFGEPIPWIQNRVQRMFKDGLKVGGKTYAVEFVFKDNESSPKRSAVVASELVLSDKCDLILVGDGDAYTPVGTLGDARGIPSITTLLPWEAFLFPRGSDPAKGFPYSFAFFWGAGDIGKNFVQMWESVKTNKKVGTLYGDSPTGRAFGDPQRGLPAEIKKAGFDEVPTGYFQIDTDDFSNQVATFKNANTDIISGFTFASQWITFWNQAAQAGLKPEVCTIAAAFLFPSAVDALGKRGDGMSTEVWWTPAYPFKSSLSGQTARQLADDWVESTGKQWTQPLGYAEALWEVAFGALRNSDPKDGDSIRDAIRNLDMETIVGRVNFKTSPIKSVAVTSLAGGQWRLTKGGRFPYELLIVNNGTAPFIPKQANLELLSQLS